MHLSAAFMFLALSPVCYPPVPKGEGEIASFDALVARVKRIAAREDWKREGWTDARLQEAVVRIAGDLKAAARTEGFKVPVAFSDVKPAGGTQTGSAREKLLVVVPANKPYQGFSSCKSCIVLAEGDLDLITAEDCVVIAGGAIRLRGGSRNLIIARRSLAVFADGDPKAAGSGSLLIAGGPVTGRLNGSLVNAPRGVSTPVGNGGYTTVNTPVNAGGKVRAGAADIKGARLALEPVEKPNPLEGKVDIVEGLPKSYSRSEAGVIVRIGGLERVIRVGAEVTDAAGKPVPELAGWRLDYISTMIPLCPTVVFAKGDDEAVFETKPPAERR